MSKIILFGDTILAGAVNGEATDIFTNRIQRRFSSDEIQNLSIPGHKSSDALTHVERDVSSKNPDVVVLSFGTNDISTIHEMKPGAYTSNLSLLMKSIGADKCVLISPSYVNWKKNKDRSWPRQVQFELATEHTAKKFDAPYVDLLAEMDKSPNPDEYLQEDGLNFSDKGYDLLEEMLVPKIQHVLNRDQIKRA